ncbi:hypothetical protein EVAR_5808_1 [Eumeta japonica]|uniref:Uncharacterized protein n=1 Tax=Eumeta variegata TaxID=151549 RepID=A0A4C1T5H9_EUMVA|nr:hypothetical protein EVAR_5808_1 [Eumeta japonica]
MLYKLKVTPRDRPLIELRSVTNLHSFVASRRDRRRPCLQSNGVFIRVVSISFISCVRPLSLFYSDASVDGVEERSLVPRSCSHARLRRNATMSHAFSCVQPAFVNL